MPELGRKSLPGRSAQAVQNTDLCYQASPVPITCESRISAYLLIP
jgi:hypothetical protein